MAAAHGRPGGGSMSALAAGDPQPGVLTAHWLAAPARAILASTVRSALAVPGVHPVAAVHLADVLTELHVAAARDAVWPALAARVRLATGWEDDVLPVRLSAAEVSSVLALPGLPAAVRTLLDGREQA